MLTKILMFACVLLMLTSGLAAQTAEEMEERLRGLEEQRARLDVEISEIRAALGKRPERLLDLGNGVSMRFVWIEPGRFAMGSPLTEEGRSDDEGPQHWVEFGKGFWLGETEVTQAQYRAVTGENPSRFKGDTLPVEQVSWDDADAFCKRLSGKLRVTARLPGEAEWEYACRAGSPARFCFGDDDADLGVYAWYDENAKSTTHPVGQKRPNAWGLYDMYGNVSEWSEDVWHDSYRGAPEDGRAWTTGGDPRRVQRGGSWDLNPWYCRSADRDGYASGGTDYDGGFRVCMDP
jgi:formylglycine-generating enzyme required for sulfatase activity